MENNMRFIAECGLNHNGNLDLLFEMIKQAKWAGATDAKFQLGWRAKPGEMNHLDSSRVKDLIDFCNYMEINPLFSIFNFDAYNVIEAFNMPEFKIASRTVKENPDLINSLLDAKKKLIISLGLWDKDELPFGTSDQINYLWCIAKYPVLPSELVGMPKSFLNSKFTGYSDHTLGIEAGLLSIARGAKIIEKHFTLDKSDTTIRDHALSATPDEFFSLTSLGKEIYKLVHNGS